MRAAILRNIVWTSRSQWWPAQTIAAWHEQELVRMMRHACSAVPFYRALGIHPESIGSAADLQRFPILTKRDLQTEPARFLADGTDLQSLYSSKTSGSTGEPTTTYFDVEAWALSKYALKIRRLLAITHPFLRRCLIISEKSPEEARDYSRERPFGGGFLYSERVISMYEDMKLHRQVVRQYSPHMIYAYPSYLLELERSYREAGEPPPHVPFLFTSSEVLTSATRGRIEEAFRGRLFDIYGSTEFKEIACQCHHGNYHLNFESVYIETLNSDMAPTQPLIAVSTVCNRAMPLLRLQIGDVGFVRTSGCACGRQSPQLQISEGRAAEVLELPSGRRISQFALTSIVETVPGVSQYCIRHTAPDRLVVELTASRPLSPEAMEGCRARLLDMLQEPMEISVQRVENFARHAGGKHRAFVRTW